jgi:phosphoglycolate phosphatase-like HAD superfamily hydrolase
MASLRIAFDIDGTLADLASAYAEVEDRLFGPANSEHSEHVEPEPEEREAEQKAGPASPNAVHDRATLLTTATGSGGGSKPPPISG